MENNNNILNEIEKTAPFLSKTKRELPFGVPDQYFENMPFEIQKKIVNKEPKKNRLIYLLQQPQYAIAASLLVILMVTGSVFVFHKTDRLAQNNTIYWDEIIDNQALIEKFDETSLIEAYIDETHNQLTNEESKKDQSISEEEISDFIEKEYSNDVFNEL